MTHSDLLLKNFNPGQISAIQSLDGPLLVSAGAGSGKTRVLTYRIARLIQKKRALPGQILAVTFTNKAAGEMRERVYTLIKKLNIPLHGGGMWISTFHSLCARLLKENKPLLSNSSTFTIYDNKDQLALVKKIMRDMNINEKIYNPKTFASQIALCKRQGLRPEDITRDNFPAYGNRFQDLYFNYEQELKQAGAFDFEGLLLETHKMFLKYPECLEKYRNQFRYISVDEYQDTNHIQYLIIKTLAENHRNLCVVGDEDQSIYSWRGADISNILNFDRDFPECKTVKLEQNYRSTSNIIRAASALISYNQHRKDKKLFTNNPTGELIQLYETENENKEAWLIAGLIEGFCQDRDYSYEDFAIFYRTNAQSRVLEEALLNKNIPYKIVGNLKFYDRMEIKDILAYLKVIVNPQDEVSLKRVLNSPKRGIGAGAVNIIAQESRRLNKSFYETMKYLSETNQMRGAGRSGIMEFVQTITELQSVSRALPLSDFYKEVLDKTRYAPVLKANQSIESLSRLENLQELGNVISQFETENKKNSLEAFLEEMALRAPSDQVEKEPMAVTLMTLHVSKGLEFNTVFMTGMEDGLFPLPDDSLAGASKFEEERRLAYVGMTRAKKHLYLSYAGQRSKFGKKKYNIASRFLNEIPARFIKAHSFRNSKGFFQNKYKRNTKYGSWYNGRSKQSLNSDDDDYSSARFDSESPNIYEVGKVVHHPRYGAGKIHKVEGSGEDLRVSVVFKNRKIKKFVAKYSHLSL